jgi:hypothetical protein
MLNAHKNRGRGLSYIIRRDKLKNVKIFKPRPPVLEIYSFEFYKDYFGTNSQWEELDKKFSKSKINSAL